MTIEAFNDEKRNIVVAHRKANVSVPVTVKPKVNAKEAITFCCGDPILIQRSCNCESCRKGHCSFVISQNICIEIPIEFSADAIVKEVCISCEAPDNNC